MGSVVVAIVIVAIFALPTIIAHLTVFTLVRSRVADIAIIAVAIILAVTSADNMRKQVSS